MKNDEPKDKKFRNVIKYSFFAGLACFIISGAFGSINGFDTFSDVLSVVGIGLSAVSIMFNVIGKKLYHSKKVILMIPVILIALVSYMIVRDFTVLKLLLIMLGTLGVSFRQVISFDLKIRLAVICLIAIFFMLNMIPSGDVLRAGGGGIRHALGFTHPNILGMYVLIVVLEVNYLFMQHRKALLVVDFLGILFELFVPNSRMPAIIIGAMMVYLIGRRLIDKILARRIIKTVIIGSFVIFSAASIIFGAVGSSGEFFGGLNKLTSNRLKLYHVAMQTTDITALGNDKEHNVHNNVVLDNAYLELLLTFGVVQMLLYMIFSVFTYRKLYKKKDYILIWILFLLGWFGLAETAYIYVTINIFLASYGLLLTTEDGFDE